MHQTALGKVCKTFTEVPRKTSILLDSFPFQPHRPFKEGHWCQVTISPCGLLRSVSKLSLFYRSHNASSLAVLLKLDDPEERTCLSEEFHRVKLRRPFVFKYQRQCEGAQGKMSVGSFRSDGPTGLRQLAEVS